MAAMLLTKKKKKMIFCCAQTRIHTNMYARVKTQSLHVAYLQLLWRQVPAGHLLLTGTVCRRLCDTLRNRQKNDMQARFTPPVQQTATILMMIIIMIITRVSIVPWQGWMCASSWQDWPVGPCGWGPPGRPPPYRPGGLEEFVKTDTTYDNTFQAQEEFKCKTARLETKMHEKNNKTE